MCYNTNVKGGKSVFDHGAFLVNGVSDSGFTALFDANVSREMFFLFQHFFLFVLFITSTLIGRLFVSAQGGKKK